MNTENINEKEKLKAELKVFKIKTIKERIILIGIVILFLLEIIFVGMFMQKLFYNKKTPNKPYVAVININKEITVPYIDQITKKMDNLVKDKNCKEFLLIFNTPGGSPSASDEFNSYLKYINKKKRVNVYVESMAASGGYYIISAIKPIVANKNAIVGSIGVIMPHFVLKKLADKIGVEEDSLTIGKYKEPVSWFRKFSNKDKEYLKTHLLLPTYENFLKTVAEDRNISINKLKQYADGKIYVASLVKGILVDKISTLIKFKKDIKNRLKIKNLIFVNIPLKKNSLSFFNIKLNLNMNKSINSLIDEKDSNYLK